MSPERRDLELLLSIQVERNSAGDQDPHSGGGAQERLNDARAGVDDLLEVVEHQEELLVAQML